MPEPELGESQRYAPVAQTSQDQHGRRSGRQETLLVPGEQPNDDLGIGTSLPASHLHSARRCG